MRKPRRGRKTDYSHVLREFTAEEIAFLTLHARYGPIVRSDIAATLLGLASDKELRHSARRGKTPIDVFRLPGRLRIAFVAAIPLAKVLIASGVQLPDAPIPESWSFSADDTSGPEIVALGRAVPASEFRAMTLHDLTELRMHARYGPLIPSAKAAQLLWYGSGRALVSAIHEGRSPIGLVISQGRNKAFASTRAIAWLLADLATARESAIQAKERPSTK
jgi:hypothetical protein